MFVFIIAAFLIGYVCVAMEHPLKVNKAATALLLCVVLWTTYIFYAPTLFPDMSTEQVRQLVTEKQLIEHLGDISQILFFLLGAMTIVELVDVHGGFTIITRHITTRKKRKLLWIIALVTFFLSSILDNMTTAIIMTMLLRKLVNERNDRLIFASIIIIAANSGGAFSPIGDVTTIMLWINGNISSLPLIESLFFPAIISTIVPVILVSFSLKGTTEAVTVQEDTTRGHSAAQDISSWERYAIFAMGVGSLVFVPVFKGLTHLPPFLGILFGLGVLWVFTEIMYYRKHHIDESRKARITHILTRIDTSTILFFLGILMAVAVLQEAGILSSFSRLLDKHVGNYYIINIIIGLLSSVVDNVPLVAGAMGMYPLEPSSAVFAPDGMFWIFLAYCAGVGGSILIIGSAAGVVTMGLEKINFMWYLKNISWLALLGYLAGAGFYILQMQVFTPLLK